jgi:hypothetical protein
VDVWGLHWNINADTIDTTLKEHSDAIDGLGASAGGVTSFNTRTGAVTLISGDVTAALTFTPYDAANPAGYQTAANVTATLAPYALTSAVPQARNAARLQAQWQNAATVSDDTVWWWDMPYAGTINTLKYFTGNGSFTVAIKVNGATVTGLSAVAVSSATPATATATALNTFAAGDNITAVITGSTGSPTDALLSLAVTWS